MPDYPQKGTGWIPPPHTYKGYGLAQASDNRWLVYTARNKFLYDLAVFHAEAAACDELYFRVMADFKLHLLACATLLFGIPFGACHLFPAAPILRTLSLIGLSLAALSFIILKIRQEWLLGKFYGRCSECKAILSTANLQDIVQSPDRPHCPACKGKDPSKAKVTITKAAPQITPKPTPLHKNNTAPTQAFWCRGYCTHSAQPDAH